MLQRLQIKNFVIIKEIDITITESFYSITGETGSGKSLIVNSIEFCINGAGKVDIIATGQTYAQVIMTFSSNEEISSILDASGVVLSDDEFTISRIINQDGRKRCYINNQQVTQKLLDLLHPKLLSIYAQHSLGMLFKHSYHLEFVDYFLDNQECVKDVAYSYKRIKGAQKDIENLSSSINKRARETDYLIHMKNEIDDLQIKDGEEELLSTKRALMHQMAKKADLIFSCTDLLNNGHITETLMSISKKLSRQTNNTMFEKAIENIDSALELIDRATIELEDLAKQSCQEENIEDIEDRLFKIKELSRKYKCPSDGLNKLSEDAMIEISQIENFEFEMESKIKLLDVAKRDYNQNALILSDMRKNAAKNLEHLIKTELDLLHMSSCSVQINVLCDANNMKESGIDKVSFMVSMNYGQDLSHIEKVSSGGEMSRFMLALQLVLFTRSGCGPVIIFDEIDTGIGGKVADSVGERLRELSNSCKVIVITHQPQVASKAFMQIVVEKHSGEGKAFSSGRILNHEERVQEVARMLSGKSITQEAINAAKTYLILPTGK